MNIEIEVPEGLDPKLTALGWLVGSWEGEGNGTDHEGNDFRFEQRIQFWPGGGGYLYYLAQAFQLVDGKPGDLIEMETGFWTPKPDATLEVSLTNSNGWTEVLVGKIQVTRIDLNTDAVVRTSGAVIEHTAGQRLYGKVEGDLMYALDRATSSHELRPHMWARLRRV
ncbi:FABP family protein [Tessaracoccus sp. OH4464_COT-324]|uniref:FABP family protein n=1 Tax=Tessaracoccus sp. OH4464_COT-324 TaxID=2491059 RepID=UPI000F635664|nr:FABP family protein [Tessaracoccus sp. OH4464_COT-324]RRD46436.1 FABP family protein [Tessaracoccus sp. OH4464_COT-324]